MSELIECLIEFIKFQEINLGKDSLQRSTMRVPMKCFFDFEPGGSLCHIFSNMYCYKADHQWENFKFNDIGITREKIDLFLRMATVIFEHLVHQGSVRLPIGYIRPEVDDKIRESIKNIFNSRQWIVTENENEASHIIYPKHDPLSEYARPAFRQGDGIMIHWYYLPESYDSWVSNSFDLVSFTF